MNYLTAFKKLEAKAIAVGFDKLKYFTAPDENHKNPHCTDEKTGLTHIILQDLTINTVDTDDYNELKLGLKYWSNDFSYKTKRKGKQGYVTAVGYDASTKKYTNSRQAKVITNTAGLGHKVEVDHLNGNTYDNRRINLCTGTHAANMQNRYPYNKEISAIIYPWDHEE